MKSTPSCRGRRFGLILALIMLLALSGACSGHSDEERTAPKTPPQGFTFFDLDDNTVLTDAVRSRLSRHLGSDSITQKTTLDLNFDGDDLLQTHFPELHRLNKGLNWPPLERVEHDTVRLMYRFARRNNLPFSYVELTFAAEPRTPLLIKIETQADGDAVLKGLIDKYGPPQEIPLAQEDRRVQYWRKKDDIFLVYIHRNRYAEIVYRFVIYYTDNLKQLLADEQARREKREDRRRKAGQTAF